MKITKRKLAEHNLNTIFIQKQYWNTFSRVQTLGRSLVQKYKNGLPRGHPFLLRQRGE